jgi:hypothetical protein
MDQNSIIQAIKLLEAIAGESLDEQRIATYTAVALPRLSAAKSIREIDVMNVEPPLTPFWRAPASTESV